MIIDKNTENYIEVESIGIKDDDNLKNPKKI